MVSLREFEQSDWQWIRKHLYPGLSSDEISGMISQWNLRQYDGRYFEMLGVTVDGRLVGYVSLFQQPDGVSVGVEIAEPFRRRGYAREGVIQAMQRAAKLGYHRMVSEVRCDNVASIALHAALGFVRTEETRNRKGNRVYRYCKEI